ncbi:MAG: TMEM175 family protein [Chloroflexota bacterium]|nr:TMEM175 family protein [Chloroflexota bacterium]
MQTPIPHHESEKETGRIEAFSAGVFAIAITLLVLDIRVPSVELADEVGLATLLLER